MPKAARELTPLEVKRLKNSGRGGNELHFVGGVSGLAIQLLSSGGKTWILRTTVGYKRRDIGLGGYPDVSLAQARERARETKELIRQGVDPIEHRKSLQSQLVASQMRGLSFSDAVDRYLSVKSAELRNEKHKEQWASTLQTYALPHLGKMLVDNITTQDILLVLQPIWTDKTETASRLRGRIEAVLSWSTVSGHRTGENPARWAGNLKELLPSPSKIAKSGNWPAIALVEADSWFEGLRLRDGTAARALEFLALCASRSGEVRKATWSEIDHKQKTWVIPGERMKVGKDHRVPLSATALALLDALPKREDSPFIFPAPRGGPLSDMALSAVMRRMHSVELDNGRPGWRDPRNGHPAVPHGLRSTFRDWAAESGFARDMAEIALSHSVGSEVERAYRRSDLIERRRGMMSAWAEFLRGATASNIVHWEMRG
ncbi:Integrase [Roseibium alexandrii DFL-11]|uniref:Integrase n=2 Tax=Roseibium alexandrii TaxID=388408 RepID=A0A5E8GWD2_ROSAD|nr:Integrase [Roseibium alexandrii DFL-11]